MVEVILESSGVAVLAIAGRLVAKAVPEMRESLMQHVKAGVDVVLDLSKMVHIDSSGLGMLVQALQKARACGSKLVLAGLQPGPKIVFDITKVSRVFTIAQTVEEAVELCGPESNASMPQHAV